MGGILPMREAGFQVLDYVSPVVDSGYEMLDHLVPYLHNDDDAWLDDFRLVPIREVEPVYVNGSTGKWTFDKAATLKFGRNRDCSLANCIGCVSKGCYFLAGLHDEKKQNISALKLTYAPQTGVFKGSFKLYAWNGPSIQEGVKPKLKKYTVNVSGVLVGGVGYGTATCKKPAVQWPVTVR